jgi:hypothetical protein
MAVSKLTIFNMSNIYYHFRKSFEEETIFESRWYSEKVSVICDRQQIFLLWWRYRR